MQSQLRRSKSFFRSGFTLIEILVVITIIGLVMAFAANRIFGQGDEAKSRLAKAQIAEIGGKLDLLKLDVGRYPTSSEGLKALLQNPGGMNNWTGPYAQKEEQIKDPWLRDFVYTSPGQRGAYDLVSLGADGKEGGDGPNRDVSN
jgi:general secretion pathway protein G